MIANGVELLALDSDPAGPAPTPREHFRRMLLLTIPIRANGFGEILLNSFPIEVRGESFARSLSKA